MQFCIEATGLCKAYRSKGRETPVLHDVSLRIAPGSFVSIAGPSGSGKSTLLSLLGCLDTADAGSLRIMGTEVVGAGEKTLATLRGRQLGFVFQSYNLISSMTALQNVEFGLKFRGVPPAERLMRAQQALAQVGLSDRADHLPAQLSGGQQQRVAVARALASKPPVLLADEPTGNLDVESAAAVMAGAFALQKEGTAVVVITHDPRLAAAAPVRYTLTEGVLRPS